MQTTLGPRNSTPIYLLKRNKHILINSRIVNKWRFIHIWNPTQKLKGANYNTHMHAMINVPQAKLIYDAEIRTLLRGWGHCTGRSRNRHQGAF